MALHEEMIKQGNWLFRWRSYLPFVAIPLVTYALTQSEILEKVAGYQVQTAWEILSISVSVFGLLIRFVAVGYSAAGTSGRNTHAQVADSLNTTGIYSVVRHPLYLGNFSLMMGFLLFTQVWWLVAVSILIFWLYYERIMYAEEEFLRQKFGSLYEDWASRTPTFFPNLRKWKKPDQPFSFRKILKREYSSLLGIIAAFFVLKFFAELLGEHKFSIKPLSFFFLGAGFLIYGILRFLSKKTTLLNPKNH